MIPHYFIATFWLLAFVVSALLGVFCFQIHRVDRSDMTPVELAAQVWFNFVGALFGWAALWCLVRRAWAVWYVPASGSEKVTGWDFGLAVVAFIGISGYLPYATMGAVRRFWDVARQAVSKITGE